MTKNDICDVVMKLFLYADMCKMIHYTTDKNHCHTLSDDTRDDIMKFADDLAEQAFGETGKPDFSDFTLKHDITVTNDISEVCIKCVELVNGLRAKDTSDSIKSLIDDFVGKMKQRTYLATFDGVSGKTLNEAVGRTLRQVLSEMYDNPWDRPDEPCQKRYVEGIATFMNPNDPDDEGEDIAFDGDIEVCGSTSKEWDDIDGYYPDFEVDNEASRDNVWDWVMDHVHPQDPNRTELLDVDFDVR